MNDFFSHTNRLIETRKAKAADVNSLFDSIAQAFDKFPSLANLVSGGHTYAVDAGAANAYTITLPAPVPTAYSAGMEVLAKIVNANTGASTLDVNGLGPVPIKHVDGVAMAGGELVAGMIAYFRYDGSAFQLMFAAPSDLSISDGTTTILKPTALSFSENVDVTVAGQVASVAIPDPVPATVDVDGFALLSVDVYTTPGAHSITVPEGALRMDIALLGAGGGGGSNSIYNSYKDYVISGAGGGGAFAFKAISGAELVDGTLTIGAKGTKNEFGSFGNNGGDTRFDNGPVDIGAGGGDGGIKANISRASMMWYGGAGGVDASNTAVDVLVVGQRGMGPIVFGSTPASTLPGQHLFSIGGRPGAVPFLEPLIQSTPNVVTLLGSITSSYARRDAWLFGQGGTGVCVDQRAGDLSDTLGGGDGADGMAVIRFYG